MKTIGISKAKMKFSEICDEVARSGRSVLITRHGKPLARIDPVVSRRSGVWEDRERYIARQGRMKEEFFLPPRSCELQASMQEE